MEKSFVLRQGSHEAPSPRVQRRIRPPLLRAVTSTLLIENKASKAMPDVIFGDITHSQRKHLQDNWLVLLRNSIELHSLLVDAWLQATERCPVWLWGVIGAYEGTDMKTHEQFNTIIDKIVALFGYMICDVQLEESHCRVAAVALGRRHQRYYPDCHQQACWTYFTDVLMDLPAQFSKKGTKVEEPARTNDTTVQSFNKRCLKLEKAWRKFFEAFIESMKAGFFGTNKTDSPKLVRKNNMFCSSRSSSRSVSPLHRSDLRLQSWKSMTSLPLMHMSATAGFRTPPGSPVKRIKRPLQKCSSLRGCTRRRNALVV